MICLSGYTTIRPEQNAWVGIIEPLDLIEMPKWLYCALPNLCLENFDVVCMTTASL